MRKVSFSALVAKRVAVIVMMIMMLMVIVVVVGIVIVIVIVVVIVIVLVVVVIVIMIKKALEPSLEGAGDITSVLQTIINNYMEFDDVYMCIVYIYIYI